MADQGKWFKLWCSSLRDDDLENLSLEDWARWARLGAHIKANGDNGTLTVNDPARALQFVLRLGSFEDIVRYLFRLPGIIIATSHITWPHGRDRDPVSLDGEIVRGKDSRSGGVATPPSVRVGTPHEEGVGMVLVKRCVSVSFVNWVKYQVDSSTDRTKRHRAMINGVDATANVTRQEEKRREEKRRDKKRYILTNPKFSPPDPEEVTAYAKTIEFDLNGKTFCDYYAARGWEFKRGQPMRDWQAAVRTWRKNDTHEAREREREIVR